MDEKAWAIIKAIISKGNDAVVRKKGDGYIVLEVKREIKYTTENRPGQGAGFSIAPCVPIAYRPFNSCINAFVMFYGIFK